MVAEGERSTVAAEVSTAVAAPLPAEALAAVSLAADSGAAGGATGVTVAVMGGVGDGGDSASAGDGPTGILTATITALGGTLPITRIITPRILLTATHTFTTATTLRRKILARGPGITPLQDPQELPRRKAPQTGMLLTRTQ